MSLAVTADDFATRVLASDKPVLVDFSARWCGPCRMLGPVVDQLARDLAATHVVATIDVDDHPAIAQTYDVSAMPTLILFQAGKPVARTVGFQSAPELRRFVLDNS